MVTQAKLYPEAHVSMHQNRWADPDQKEITFPTTLQNVDDLLSMSLGQLENLYDQTICPDIRMVSGACKGRMLSVTGWGSRFPLGGMLNRLASHDRFPWKGKNFEPLSDTNGQGINRALSNLWPLHLYRFHTSIDVSLHDGQPAFVLDYDLPENPGFIRAIRDEIRLLSPGLFLGQAWLRLGEEHHLALYFGLQLP